MPILCFCFCDFANILLLSLLTGYRLLILTTNIIYFCIIWRNLGQRPGQFDQVSNFLKFSDILLRITIFQWQLESNREAYSFRSTTITLLGGPFMHFIKNFELFCRSKGLEIPLPKHEKLSDPMLYPSSQTQMKLPSVLLHVCAQVPFLSAHSSMSAKV